MPVYPSSSRSRQTLRFRRLALKCLRLGAWVICFSAIGAGAAWYSTFQHVHLAAGDLAQATASPVVQLAAASALEITEPAPAKVEAGSEPAPPVEEPQALEAPPETPAVPTQISRPAIPGAKPAAAATSPPAAADKIAPTPAQVAQTLAKRLDAAPRLRPEVLALTYVGGPGNQWVQQVGFVDGKVVARSGTDARTAPRGFAVFYTADGKFLGVEGDLNAVSGGLKGEKWTGGVRVQDEATGVSLEINYKQVGKNLQQPNLTSSAGWKWWGWGGGQATERKLMADSRGVRVHVLPGGLFLSKCWCDGGNTTLARDPQDLAKGNVFTQTGFQKGGKGTLYMIGDLKTGTPLFGTWAGFRPNAEAVDAWGRLYATEIGRAAGSADDALKFGGDGFYVLDPTLSKRLYLTSLGVDRVCCMAIKDNLLVIGGAADAARAVNKLPLKNPAQATPGGDEDGYLAIIKLW